MNVVHRLICLAENGRAEARYRLEPMFCLALLLSGCGGGEATTTVTGKIAYKGAPVAAGVINFVGAGRSALGGAIQSDGTYRFDLPPGQYQVLVNAPAPVPPDFRDGDKLGPRLAPEKYANVTTSGLSADVGAESSQQIDFLLD